MLDKLNDTIVAIATPRGKSAIGIIRMSGSNAFKICFFVTKKYFDSDGKYYINFYDKDSLVIDKGLILIFKKPCSYTSEDSVEFHTHGNELILNALLNRLIFLGARVAEPGEFSFRAYLYGKMDILQAESINTLINAKTLKSNNALLNTITGKLSSEIKNIISDITFLRCNLESSIDFPDDVSLRNGDLLNKFQAIYKPFISLHKQIGLDNLVLDDFKIVLIGKSNAGKSSLFNYLVNKNRSIVTSLPGTTRDFLEDDAIIDDYIFKIVDTAGLNITSNCKIEKNGILKSFEQMKYADIIILMFDVKEANTFIEHKIFDFILNYLSINKKLLIVKNKIDLCDENLIASNYQPFVNELYVSIKKNIGLDILLKQIKNIYMVKGDNNFIVNKRHFLLFIKIKKKMKRLNILIKANAEYVFLAEILRNIDVLLSDLIGENYNDKLINKIFSKFCIGK